MSGPRRTGDEHVAACEFLSVLCGTSNVLRHDQERCPRALIRNDMTVRGLLGYASEL